MAKRVETKVIKSPESRRSYRLGELLGKGGFGTVWRCTTSALKGQLCLKLTRDQESWLREAYMAKLIGDHPRVVTVHEAFPVLEGGRVEYAVVMELAEHGTAADLVEREGPMPEARAVAEIGRLLGAVEELHASGALHRDITPYNVFACGPKKTLKLADFGITTHGPRKGVAADAFAPWFVDRAIREEQRARWDLRDDLWQVAQVLAVLLSGKVEAIRAGDVRTIPASSSTRAVIARAIGDRAHRYESARAMADALRDAGPPPGPARPRSLKGRTIVFTGRLAIPRAKAATLARKAGAAVMPSVNAETDLLVVGESSRWGAGDAGGRKILAAAAKREGGRRIDWITGEWFLKLVGAA
ncbi:MAG: protein kinase [Myxococcales bacterium]|nr:protein kinase [Myxococcales bacterium]